MRCVGLVGRCVRCGPRCGRDRGPGDDRAAARDLAGWGAGIEAETGPGYDQDIVHPGGPRSAAVGASWGA